ncbi:hypothetical protein [Pedobacter sp. Hv1]|uniref:hypothetical protein n=1 Tax=Pedobacter sp. Hv1 TaxID=1740090 RepID=UPI0006D8961B|nr:hypothetical protein [Pedobacter sp. Hv1]KQB99494.1 hypothetical protein AQF98_18190 [Pedobacter sp. Hv1]
MKNDHLTDNDIQAHVFNKVSEDDIVLHISTCTVCKAKVTSYQALLHAIDEIEPETFPFDTTRLAMLKIEQFKNKKSTTASYILYAFLGIFILTVFVVCIPYITPIFKTFQEMNNITNAFVIVSTLSVLIFFLTVTFRQYKQKIILLTA